MRSTPQSILDFIAITVFSILTVWLGWLTVRSEAVVWWLKVTLSIITFVVAYVAADFTSGFVHFLGDTFGDEHTPFFGKRFIFPFREHHVDQKAITHHSFLHVNGNNCFVSLIILVPTLYFFPKHPHLPGVALGFFLMWFVLFIFLTNQFHKWAHADTVSPFVRWLQLHGFILSPEHHVYHHTAPFRTYFCITSGWLNESLERVGLFALIRRTFKREEDAAYSGPQKLRP